MFKRLFLLSGIIALLLTAVVMFTWYIPRYGDLPEEDTTELTSDTVISVVGDTVSE